MEQPIYIYYIDENDLIYHINEEWKQFAIENEGSYLVDETLGKPIWDFISEGLIKKLYKELIAAVRKTQEEINISFRCDSPEKLRFMQMNLYPIMENGIAFQNILLKEKLKEEGYTPEVLAILGEAGYPMCSKCNKIKINSEWIELEEALKRKLLENKNLKAHYGICSECATSIKNSIEELRIKVKI